MAVIGSTVQLALKLHAEIVAEHLSLRRAEAREIVIKVARASSSSAASKAPSGIAEATSARNFAR